MPRQAFTDVLQDSGARQPGRTVIRLLLRRPRRLTLALGAFVLKETPVWVLPVITARVIDVVAEGGDVREVLGWFALALALLVQNYPNHLVYVRNFMTVVRDTGMELRRAIVTHLQRLSIGYHSRVSSSVVQTKLVRDVENVELMLQQLTHPLLSSTTVLLGAVTMTAIMVSQFLPVYALAIPLALAIRAVLARRSRRRNAAPTGSSCSSRAASSSRARTRSCSPAVDGMPSCTSRRAAETRR